MRPLVITLALLAIALPALAADPKPNTLTPKEIADGWLLLFDGETTFGWDILGDAKVEGDSLLLGGEKATVAMPTSTFGDYQLQFDYKESTTPGYKIQIKNTAIGGTVQRDWKRMAIVVDGRDVRYRHGVIGQNPQIVSASDQIPARSHPRIQVDAGRQLALRNVIIRPLRLQSIFNGKDLSGWNVYKGDPKREKSTFTATKDGWLNIKDGPGDLQTVGEWSDFVLQFDCLSNGKHLNSGVFFRCRPGEYQQGYEAQVRNEFTAEPKQKYLIEEYDPKTGELKGKKDVMSPAVDYGTGAIYRRVPARKEMSKDGEWFTMTVVANGRHLATWVNGVQVTDWTDNRPLKDNARNGCRLEKGPISLQGHDPTTDLSFRNFRIAELPAKK